MKKKPEFWGIHHLCPKSKWWTDIEENYLELPRKVHNAIHFLFQNKLPAEQILTLLNINASALTEDFKGRVKKVLEDSKDYTYNNWILIKK